MEQRATAVGMVAEARTAAAVEMAIEAIVVGMGVEVEKVAVLKMAVEWEREIEETGETVAADWAANDAMIQAIVHCSTATPMQKMARRVGYSVIIDVEILAEMAKTLSGLKKVPHWGRTFVGVVACSVVLGRLLAATGLFAYRLSSRYFHSIVRKSPVDHR